MDLNLKLLETGISELRIGRNIKYHLMGTITIYLD